jgi:hypothetical protein
MLDNLFVVFGRLVFQQTVGPCDIGVWSVGTSQVMFVFLLITYDGCRYIQYTRDCQSCYKNS